MAADSASSKTGQGWWEGVRLVVDREACHSSELEVKWEECAYSGCVIIL